MEIFGGSFPQNKSFNSNKYFGEDVEFAKFLLDNPSCFVVAIGASDGITASDTAQAFKRLGRRWLMVDAYGVNFAQHSLNYMDENDVELLRKRILPQDVPALIGSYGLDKRPFVLSLDIDSKRIQSWVTLLKKCDYGLNKICSISIICKPPDLLAHPMSAEDVFKSYYENKSWSPTPISHLIGNPNFQAHSMGEIFKILAEYDGNYFLGRAGNI